MYSINCLGVITARSGSKSIKHKNLQEIQGKNLLEWTASAISKSSIIEKCLITTDSQNYANYVEPFGVDIPFIRPREISNDKTTDAEVFGHLCEYLRTNRMLPKYLIHFRPTTPFRDPSIIDSSINHFLQSSADVTSMRSVHQMPESAYKCFEIDDTGLLIQVFTKHHSLDSSNNPKEAFPKTYFPNGYIDIIITEHFLETGLLHGDAVLAQNTEAVIEIDSAQDLELARVLAERNPLIYDKVFS